MSAASLSSRAVRFALPAAAIAAGAVLLTTLARAFLSRDSGPITSHFGAELTVSDGSESVVVRRISPRDVSAVAAGVSTVLAAHPLVRSCVGGKAVTGAEALRATTALLLTISPASRGAALLSTTSGDAVALVMSSGARFSHLLFFLNGGQRALWALAGWGRSSRFNIGAAALAVRRDRIMCGKQQYLHLSLVAAAPGPKSESSVRAIVKYITSAADAAMLPVFAEVAENLVDVLRSVGFEVAETMTLFGCSVTLCLRLPVGV